MKVNHLLAGTFLLGALTLTACNNNNSKQQYSQTENIIENRRNNYLERVAADAEIQYNCAQTYYNHTLVEQANTDSTKAKKTLNDLEADYQKSMASLTQATEEYRAAAEEGNEYNAYKNLENVNKQVAPVIQTYQKAQKDLEIARGSNVKNASESLEDIHSKILTINGYRQLSMTPIEKRTEEDNAKLDSIYNFVRTLKEKAGVTTCLHDW